MTPGPGIEPGPLWWKASALATAPSLIATVAQPFGRVERIVNRK